MLSEAIPLNLFFVKYRLFCRPSLSFRLIAQKLSPTLAIETAVITVHARYRNSGKKCYSVSGMVLAWVSLFRYRTGSDISISFHFDTGLTGCHTVRHLKNCRKGGNMYSSSDIAA
jgi:hypothetical protein